MAYQQGPLVRSITGCLAFVVLAVLIVASGANTALLLGGLSLVGGFGLLGDRRRDSFTGFGMMAFGATLLIIGLVMKSMN